MGSEINFAAPKMFLQPRVKDKKVILNALGYFDGFQIGASLPASQINFIQQVGKPFFVDPMAYMFTLAPDHVINKESGNVRPSLSALAGRYSPIFEAALGKRSVTAEEIMRAAGALEELTHNTLEYQRTKFQSNDLLLLNHYYDKYDALELDDDKSDHETQATAPCLIIPPYFFIKDISDPWYLATLLCARMATEHKKEGEQLYPALFIDKDLLIDFASLDQIANDFSEAGFDGIIVWVNGMSEESASPESMAGLLHLVAKLSSKGKPVMKLFGGALSIMMHSHGISAFSCTLSYKTSRDIFAYMWMPPGPPKVKFYIPKLHQSYDLEESFHIMNAFPFLRCTCGVCRSAYGSDLGRFVDQMKIEGYCQNHFLNARRQELNLISQRGLPGALEAIDETLRRLEKKTAKGARHLLKWREVLGAAAKVGTGTEVLAKLESSPRLYAPRA